MRVVAWTPRREPGTLWRPPFRVTGYRDDPRDGIGGRWGLGQVSTALMPWAAHVRQWPVQRVLTQTARWGKSQKAGRGADRSLQPDCVKVKSLVTAGQDTAVNTFPGAVHTANLLLPVVTGGKPCGWGRPVLPQGV